MGIFSKLYNKTARAVLSRFAGSADLAQELSMGEAENIEVTDEIRDLIRRAGAEGCVLLENDGVLPLEPSTRLSVFGRAHQDYFYVGYGSGGDVRIPYKVNIIDALKDRLELNQQLAGAYAHWCSIPKNIPDEGFWGHWPSSHPEMPLSLQQVSQTTSSSDTALVIIGRGAGESQDASLKKGSYYLDSDEETLLEYVTKVFSRVVVVINSGNLIDFSWLEKYGDKISALLLAWQGGMESGNILADVLLGTVNPSGKLVDSIAKNYKSYPSSSNFGGKSKNLYSEDIFVGYRYFETFAKDAVLYPFGHGLSYTSFERHLVSVSDDASGEASGFNPVFEVEVRNSGSIPGREVVQIYASAPLGKLLKPSRVLCGFAKTPLLAAGESCRLSIQADPKDFASFDDSGITGYPAAFVLESGEYSFYMGGSVTEAKIIHSLDIADTIVLEQLEEIFPLRSSIQRIAAKTAENSPMLLSTPVPKLDLRQRIIDGLPEDIPYTGGNDISFQDVQEGKSSLQEFIAQLSPREMEVLSRGYGPMNSPLGPLGNAGAFGGVTEDLRARGIAPITTVDGPAGIRLHQTCSLLPCATALACSWDTNLLEELFTELGSEIKSRGADIILSPGLNIHRNPLCGRNFEYYSEDPLISGKMAAATVRAVQSQGVAACPKHFACNNQEFNRNKNDSLLSQRALREIYLRGFEICVKESRPISIMTAYNKINGVWCHYSYDLCTTVLRKEWGFDGLVMTDWWMQYSSSPEFPDVKNDAYRIRAQVDLLMPGGRNQGSKDASADNSIAQAMAAADTPLSIGELQISAKHVLECVLKLKNPSYFFEKK